MHYMDSDEENGEVDAEQIISSPDNSDDEEEDELSAQEARNIALIVKVINKSLKPQLDNMLQVVKNNQQQNQTSSMLVNERVRVLEETKQLEIAGER